MYQPWTTPVTSSSTTQVPASSAVTLTKEEASRNAGIPSSEFTQMFRYVDESEDQTTGRLKAGFTAYKYDNDSGVAALIATNCTVRPAKSLSLIHI